VLGSAILAAVAAGLYPSIPAASAAMVRFTATIEPDPATHEQYAFYFERYQETYPALRDLMHRTARHVAGTG
jgi:sugar (pentulose or hexulose) kinase